jgi:hypothetical protein
MPPLEKNSVFPNALDASSAPDSSGVDVAVAVDEMIAHILRIAEGGRHVAAILMDMAQHPSPTELLRDATAKDCAAAHG